MTFIMTPACRKKSEDFKIFKIKKGNHYCNGYKGEISEYFISFEFIFSENCLYNENELEYTGWNKIYGIGGNPHNNSARVGWRSNGDEILLSYYVYINKERIIIPAETTKPNQINRAKIMYFGGKLIMNINGKIEEFKSLKPKFPLVEYPYFGGKSVSPHDMTIKIRKL